jgi:uncharacterized protein (DUF433 family)
MRTHEASLFTAVEAAVLTRRPLKAVNNAIDKKTVATVARGPVGHAARLLDLHGLMSLALSDGWRIALPPERRRAVFDALVSGSRNRVSLNGGFLTIDLREPRRELAESLRKLRRVRALVTSDPDTLGVDPVFRGTRVPVHLIATLLEQGSTEADLLVSYPRLTGEMAELAPVYAAAYPLRGRPRAQPWHGQAPKRTSCGVGKDIARLCSLNRDHSGWARGCSGARESSTSGGGWALREPLSSNRIKPRQQNVDIRRAHGPFRLT